MYVAWGDDLPDRLRDEGLHQWLKDAGVSRLQLNLDDAEVAPAMRIATAPDPIAAIVSVWADSDADVTATLSEATSRLAGWEVIFLTASSRVRIFHSRTTRPRMRVKVPNDRGCGRPKAV